MARFVCRPASLRCLHRAVLDGARDLLLLSLVQALWRRKPNNDDEDWVLQNQDEYFHEVSDNGAQEGEGRTCCEP